MDFLPHAPLNRIPGTLVAKEKHTKDLTKVTHAELLEMKEREKTLLANKARLSRLPDKGKRIQDYYDKILEELKRRDSIEEAAMLFSALNIASKGKEALNKLEWQGRHSNGNDEDDPSVDLLDSDDECEMDPLRVLAQRTMHERRVKVLPPESSSLITANDLAEIQAFKSESPDSGVTACETASSQSANSSTESKTVDAELMEVDVASKLGKIKEVLAKSPLQRTTNGPVEEDNEMTQHSLYLIEKTELNAHPMRNKFKPYRTTISNVHDPSKERKRKVGKYWEVTAATPPPIQHNETQLLSLTDSVELQNNYLDKLKELQFKQAEERLARKMQLRKLELPDEATLNITPAFQRYRTTNSEFSIEGNQRLLRNVEEEHDPSELDGKGGVRFAFKE